MRSRFLLAALAGLFLPCAAAADPKSSPIEGPGATSVIGSTSDFSKVGDKLSETPSERAERPRDGAEGDAAHAAPAVKPKPSPPSLVARINLTSQRMDVSVGGANKYSWAISSGRSGYETPRGSFRAQWTAKMWHSRTYDMAPMPHAVFFKDGVAVHATSSTGMLGSPASHGCVRLAPANAAAFYALVQKHGVQNTQVQVFGSEPKVARRETPRPAPRLAGPAYGNQRITYLPPGSPYAGRPSFVHNGVLYVKVR